MLAATAMGAAAQVGNAAMPIYLHMKRGADSLAVRGVLAQNVACCTYVFKARAGQKLYWRRTGAAARLTLAYPDGHMDGPGLPNPLTLPVTGAYTLAVSPDLMAEGAYGPFTLTLRIPPGWRRLGSSTPTLPPLAGVSGANLAQRGSARWG